MSAVKKFFERKRLDWKFRNAGPGRTLNSASTSTAIHKPSFQHQEQAEEQRGATGDMSVKPNMPDSELKAEKSARKFKFTKKKSSQTRKRPKKAGNTSPKPSEAIDFYGGVFYTCELLLPGVLLPKDEIDEKILEYLLAQMYEDAEMASALLIYTVNKDHNKVSICIETICEYLDGLQINPTDERFKKIRCSDKDFVQKVKSVEGGCEFLQCCGYELRRLPFEDGEDDFLIMSEEVAQNTGMLNYLKEVLIKAEPIEGQLWRAPRLFSCQETDSNRFGEIPDEFFIPAQKDKTEKGEEDDRCRQITSTNLDKMTASDQYRYTLIRVGFPDDIYLQSIFKTTETLSDLKDYIREQLEFHWLPFELLTATGTQLSGDNKTLAELQLVPAILVMFSYDKTLLESYSDSSAAATVLQTSLLDRLEDLNVSLQTK